jgi:hypothetical protein
MPPDVTLYRVLNSVWVRFVSKVTYSPSDIYVINEPPQLFSELSQKVAFLFRSSPRGRLLYRPRHCFSILGRYESEVLGNAEKIPCAVTNYVPSFFVRIGRGTESISEILGNAKKISTPCDHLHTCGFLVWITQTHKTTHPQQESRHK